MYWKPSQVTSIRAGKLRERVPAYAQDRWLAPDIASSASILKDPGLIGAAFPELL
ncbi:hypothetical protein IRZ57_15190 [Pseudomonas guariconensis]|nr:hypothetical protein [Pseudomonas guariconensis]MBF8756521.1 hypothetical protein [Pseudomonas guariconensis]